MSQRQEIEDQYTVACKNCGHEIIDPAKSPGQKYIIGECPKCHHVRTDKDGYVREILAGGVIRKRKRQVL